MRLIDADALKERAIRVSTVKEHTFFKAVGTREIDKAPTIDAVPVVRCKECIHTRKKNGHEQFMYNENVCICTKEDIWGITKNEPVWDDGYCHNGERRTDGL